MHMELAADPVDLVSEAGYGLLPRAGGAILWAPTMRFLPAVVTGTTTQIGPKLPEPIRAGQSSARTHPQVKIPGPGGNYLALTKVDADLALSAEQSTAQGQ